MVSVSVLVLLLFWALWCCRSLLFLFVYSQNGLTHKLELTLKHTTDKVLPAVTIAVFEMALLIIFYIFILLIKFNEKKKKILPTRIVL